MDNRLIRKRLKSSLLFITILVSILSLFNFNFIKNNSIIYQKESFHRNSEIDFDIPSPSFNQLIEISNNPNVDSVFGYHFAYITLLDKNSREQELTLIMSDYFEEIEFTSFGEKNAVFYSNDTLNDFVFLDYKASEVLGKRLDDEVNFDLINQSYQITRILNSVDYFPGGVIFLSYQGAIKNYFDQFIINDSYSGAFIKAKNIQQLNSYLLEYKPLGRQYPRDSFSTDEEYQIHLNSWNNTSYYNEITKFSTLELTPINSSFLLFSIVFSMLILFVYQYFLFIYIESNYFKKINEDIKLIQKYYNKFSIFESIFFLLLSLVILYVLISISTLYFPTTFLVPTLLSYALISFFGLVFTLFFKKKVIKSLI
jgi:hypothetical protein